MFPVSHDGKGLELSRLDSDPLFGFFARGAADLLRRQGRSGFVERCERFQFERKAMRVEPRCVAVGISSISWGRRLEQCSDGRTGLGNLESVLTG